MMQRMDAGTLWWMTCLKPSCGIIQRVPKDFFADNVTMKSHLLNSMLISLKHAPPLEIFWPKLWVLEQFPLLGERGVLAETTYVTGTTRRRTRRTP